MKLLIFSDLHCHNWTQFAHTDATGLNSRLLDQLGVLGQIRQTCITEGVYAIIFCGDLFHSRVKIDVDVFWAIQEAFRQLREVAPGGIYALVGNHDQSTKDGSIHSISWINGHLGLTIQRPMSFYIDNVHVVAHPFTTDTNAFIEYCKTVPKCDLFLGHQGIDGALVGAYEVALKAEIPLGCLPADRARYVFMGHYHKHQWLKPNVCYVGSPLQLDFGERNEKKGFLLLDTDTWKVKYVASKAPRFKLYKTIDAFHEALEHKNVDIRKDFIRIHGPAGNRMDALKELCPRAHLVTEHPNVNTLPRIEATLAASDRELLTAYIERSKTELAKDKLLADGIKFLEDQ